MKKKLFFLLFIPLALRAQEKSLLWLPYSNQSVNEFFNRITNNEFKLTIALSSKNGLEMQKLKNYLEQKKIEIINIPEGTPFISLLYYPKNSGLNYFDKLSNNPYFFALRINVSTQKYKKDFGDLSGLVLPYGDINKEYIHLAKAYGYSWLPSGLPKDTNNTIMQIDNIKVVPFKVLSSSTVFDDFNFYLIDDTLSISSSSVEMLINIFSDKKHKFLLTSQLINISTFSTISFENFNLSFYPWKAYNEYILVDEQYGIATVLSVVRNDIMSYLNLNSQKTNEILARYANVEKYLGLYPLVEDKAEAENEIRKNLEEIYQLMGRPGPDFIYRSLKNLNENRDKYKILTATENLIYYSVNSSTENSIFEISTFTVSLKNGFIEFEISCSQPFPENYFLEIYMDINGRARLGATNLLGKKSERIIHTNAWEYAISTENGNVTIYQSAYNKIIKRGEFPLKKSGTKINLKIPGSLIKGSYLNWVYLPLIYLKKNDAYTRVGGIFSKEEQGYIYPVLRQ